jgi:hypothetical protein
MDIVAGLVTEYDGQGLHRTGTMVDRANAEWLRTEIRDAGLEATFSSFEIDRLEQTDVGLTIGNDYFSGVVQFDGGFTDPEGISGTMGALGSNCPVGLRTSDNSDGELVEARREHRHEAIVSVGRGNEVSPYGMYLANAPSFESPFGPPVLHVAPKELPFLRDAVSNQSPVTCRAVATRIRTDAINVEAKLSGENPDLPPLIVQTARSRWWNCASERGTGLAAWLCSIRRMQENGASRNVHFIATTGHELDHLGLGHAMARASIVSEGSHWI